MERNCTNCKYFVAGKCENQESPMQQIIGVAQNVKVISCGVWELTLNEDYDRESGLIEEE